MKEISIQILSESDMRNIIDSSVREIITDLFRNTASANEEYLTRQETAALLKLSLPTLHEYSRLGLIKSYRLGKTIRYKGSDIDKALKEIKFIKHRRNLDTPVP
jgi:excisionase family DNA binding protein